jgi:hypothetical protein
MGNPSANIIPLPRVAKGDQPRLTTNEELAEAVALAQGNLLRQQKPDGHWVGELMVDSTLCSDYVLFMHWLGEVDETLQRRCAKHILNDNCPMAAGTFIMAARAKSTPASKPTSPSSSPATVRRRPSCRKPAPIFCGSAASRG